MPCLAGNYNPAVGVILQVAFYLSLNYLCCKRINQISRCSPPSLIQEHR
jgi:hypothetical protein